MKNIRLYLIPVALLAGIFSSAHAGGLSYSEGGTGYGWGNATDPRDFNSYYAPAYQLPDPATMPPSATRGKQLLYSTYKYLGKESGNVAANGRPFVGNKLNCVNCHMANGTQPNASPWVVVAKKYAPPGLYNSRANIFMDVPNRVNGCFERSMAGEALPRDSQWMKDIVAYMDFLATGIQPGYTFKQVKGQEYPAVALLTLAADPVRGKNIYNNNCASCHQSNGQGVWLDYQKRYLYPAVWGNNSFGLMSGAGRLATLTTVVWGTMPLNKVNTLDPSTRMPQADAWDVAAYLLSKDRPFYARFVNDWTGVGPDGMPNWLRKPASASYDYTMPRVADDGTATGDPSKPPMFPRTQHTFGPFQPIEAALKAARNARGFP